MAPILTIVQARATLASRVSHHHDQTAVGEAKRDLAAANIAAAIERALADAPPLTDDQCDRLADILRGRALAPQPPRPKRRKRPVVVVEEARP